jgi:hypothetical protein
MEPKIKILIGGTIIVLIFGITLFFVLRHKSKSTGLPYSCHNWTPAEQQQLDSGVPQQQVCENGGNVFTGGYNQNYDGCKTCWCCTPN